jgi:hypothetical protein
MKIGDRVLVLGSATHLHGQQGVLVRIAERFKPDDVGSYTHRVEFGGGLQFWFQPEALRAVDAVEALASLA